MASRRKDISQELKKLSRTSKYHKSFVNELYNILNRISAVIHVILSVICCNDIANIFKEFFHTDKTNRQIINHCRVSFEMGFDLRETVLDGIVIW